MKKVFFIAMAILFTGSAVALDNVPKSGTSIQTNIGFNVSNLKNFPSYNNKVGGNLGFKMEFMLPNAYGTYINLGLDYTHKGARVTSIETYDLSGYAISDMDAYTEDEISTGEVTRKFQAHYFSIPIHIGYRYNLSEKFGVYGEIGPYLALGIAGKYRKNFEDAGFDNLSENVFGKHAAKLYLDKTYNNIRTFRRFDGGLGFRVGAEYNNQYSLNFGYDWGMADIYTQKYRKKQKVDHDITLPKLKNHNLSITFGYRF